MMHKFVLIFLLTALLFSRPSSLKAQEIEEDAALPVDTTGVNSLYLPLVANVTPVDQPPLNEAAETTEPLSVSSSAAPADGWTVFETAGVNSSGLVNKLQNPGFENGATNSADNWREFYPQVTQIDSAVVHSGKRALRLANTLSTDQRGALQVVTLNQTTAKPLLFSGWSKAQNLTGEPGENYSIYLYIQYKDGSWLYSQALPFAAGTHDWQQLVGTVVPAKPIATVYVYTLLRWAYTGVVWFDDLALYEVPSTYTLFDGAIVRSPATTPDLSSQPLRTLNTGDGLSLSLTGSGGASVVSLNNSTLTPTQRRYLGGFFVRDVGAQSNFVHVGGVVNANNNVLTQAGAVPGLNLKLNATWQVRAKAIEVTGEIVDTSGLDRALTLYFALPFNATGWKWGNDIRHTQTVGGLTDFRNTTTDGWNDSGPLSRYPWSAVTGLSVRTGVAAGISLAYALDQPSQVRLVVQPVTQQYYIAYDFGLSSAATKMRQRATFHFVVYQHQAGWPLRDDLGAGFRAATARYYTLFPQWFTKRVPATKEGIWVAFSDLNSIPRLADFGIVYHEGALNQVPFDESVGISTFRYVSEPWSYWMDIQDPAVDPQNYNQVMSYLQKQYQQTTDMNLRRRAEAALSSGSYDSTNRQRYRSDPQPWCHGVNGNCAVFTLNPDPEVNLTPYTLNKANLDWNANVWNAYATTPGLDGEYIDSFQSEAMTFDFQRSHFAASDLPLTFDPTSRQIGLPQIFSAYEFGRWLSQDVHKRGKLMMANAVFNGIPWGGDLFDFNGQEVDWRRDDGSFTLPDDGWFNYRRTLSATRPFGTLLNTDFTKLTNAELERYFQANLFYGILPSLFSANAATDTYWEQPALYERDRALFQRYIPWIRTISQAGWQPITLATASDTQGKIYLERYGSFGSQNIIYLTARNDSTTQRTFNMTLDTVGLGLPATGRIIVTEQLTGKQVTTNYQKSLIALNTWTLPAQGVALFQIQR